MSLLPSPGPRPDPQASPSDPAASPSRGPGPSSPGGVRDKAAQLLMVDIPGLTLDDPTRDHLRGAPWGGVILFAKNVDGRAQVGDLIHEIHAALPLPALMAVDQEGGLVDRFRFPEMSLSPGCMALGAVDDPQATFQAHAIMGRELRDIGIHLDFAPCLDVNVNPDNPIIGARSFGEDPERVAEHGRAAIRGLRAGGVAPTVKHFPGHGDTHQDSHLALPTVTHPRSRLDEVELRPFRAAVEEGVEAVMTAHITFPALDPRQGIPATLSEPILTGLLRQELGFQGVIVTDSMAMRGIADHFGIEEAAVRAVEAGADLILALGPFETQLRTLEALVSAVGSGRLSEARLDASLARLQALKGRYHGRPQAEPTWDLAEHQEAMRELTARSITLLGDRDGLLPLRMTAEQELLVLTPDLLPQSPLGEVSVKASLAPLLRGQAALPARVVEREFHPSLSGPATQELAGQAKRAHAVILALHARHRLNDSQRELARAVLEANPRTLVISLSSPYLMLDLPEPAACLLGYGYGPLTLEALADVILGRRGAPGRLPVTLAPWPPVPRPG